MVFSKAGRSALALTLAAFALVAPLSAQAQRADAPAYPQPKEGTFVAKEFRFHTGETLPELKLAYTTIGAPTGEPVLVLHGTAGSARSMQAPGFAGQLYGPGQPLDATKYFIIIPDAIGAGKSSKPSDGLKAKFPRYNYGDMVAGHYRLLTEGLGIKHLRLVIGNSMGGMHTWLWTTTHPTFMDAAVPMASQPTEMSSRNWMMRRLLIEGIRRDPSYQNGNYATQPAWLPFVNTMFGIATNGGTLAWQALAPTRDKADKIVDQRLGAAFKADANDFLYQWDASRDYNPAPDLQKIEAQVLVINSADDERNPPETGLMDAAMKRVKNGKVLLIPASADTRGHGTTMNAKLWKNELKSLLETAPKRAM